MAMPKAVDRFSDAWGYFLTLMDLCESSYKQYLDAGKTYLHARIIFHSNFQLRDEITKHLHLADNEFRSDLLLILHHLEIWIECWVCLDREAPHKMDDTFVFETRVAFPRDAGKRAVEYLTKRRQTIED